MSAAAVPWFAACWVLGLAGAAKLHRPMPTAGALRARGLPSSLVLVRGLAVVELALAVAGTVTSAWPVALAVAGLYGAFALFLVATLRSGGMVQTCGCFGSPDVPASPVHVAGDLVLAAAAVAVAVAGPSADLGAVADAPAEGAVVLALAAVATGLVVAALVRLPVLRAEQLSIRDSFGW